MKRLEDGKQTCPRCQGAGCHFCQRKGFVVMCPQCACIEYIESVPGEENNFKCNACGLAFDGAGNLIIPGTN